MPGNAKRSLLIQRVSAHDPEERMPPPKINKILTEYEIALLSKWIDQGAEYKTHWALIPPESPPAEATIDAFLQAGIEKAALSLRPRRREPA